MNGISLFSHAAIDALGWTLVHFLWQGSMAAGILALILLLLRRSLPEYRYAAACIVFLAMAVAPIVTWSTIRPNANGRPMPVVERIEPPPELIHDNASMALDENLRAVRWAGLNPVPVEPAELEWGIPAAPSNALSALARRVRPYTTYFVAAWSFGVLLLTIRLCAGWTRVCQVRRYATDLRSPELTKRFDELCRAISIVRPVRLLESALVEVPMVIGWLTPIVLVPVSALSGLAPNQLHALLAHELAHIRRHDYLANLVQTAIETLLFYHPAVWWVSSRIRAEREACCDKRALSVVGDRMSYARALLALEESRGRRLGLALAASGGSLLVRVSRLFDHADSPSNRSSWWLMPAMIAVVVFGFHAMHRVATFATESKSTASAELNGGRKGAEVVPGNDQVAVAADAASIVPQGSDARKSVAEQSQLSGTLILAAAIRTTEQPTRFQYSLVAVNPNNGHWTSLQPLSDGGFTFPLAASRISRDGATALFMKDNEIWKCTTTIPPTAVRVAEKGQLKCWAPDHKSFVVAELENGREKVENWICSLDGTRLSKLPLSAGDVVEDWSKDGQWLAVQSDHFQIHVVKSDGSGRTLITDPKADAVHEHPRFSPDGKRILYVQREQTEAAAYSLHVVNIDGTGARELMRETAAADAESRAAPVNAQWSPDGNHLAIILCDRQPDGAIMAINGNWRLATVTLAGPDGNASPLVPKELKLANTLTLVLPFIAPDWYAGSIPARPAGDSNRNASQARPDSLEAGAARAAEPATPIQATETAASQLTIRVRSDNEGDWKGLTIANDSKQPSIERLEQGLREHVSNPAGTTVRLEVDEPLKTEMANELVDTLKRFGITRIDLVKVAKPRGAGNASLRLRVLDTESRQTDAVYVNLWLRLPPGEEPAGPTWRDGDEVWERTRSWYPGYPKPKDGLGFDDIAAGTYRISATRYASEAGSDPTPAAASDPIEVTADVPASATLQLQGNASLRVRIRDSKTGEPVASSVIRLYRGDGMPIVGASRGNGNFFDMPDDNGEIHYGHLMPGSYRLEVSGQGPTLWRPVEYSARAPVTVSVAADEQADAVVRLDSRPLTEPELDARWPHSVHGRVVDGEGRAMPGVEITAHTGMGTLRLGGKATSDEQGRYRLRFAPGILFQGERGSSGLQIATITARRAGYFEENLSRHGNLSMANQAPAEDDSQGFAGVVLPGKPVQLDFVMLPAARFAGTVTDTKGNRLSGYRVSLGGESTPPSSGVVASTRTDERGRFELTDIPTQFQYQLLIEPPKAEPPWLAWASSPIQFRDPGERDVFVISNNSHIVADRFQIRLAGDGQNWRSALKEAASTAAKFRDMNSIRQQRSDYVLVEAAELQIDLGSNGN